MARFQEVPAVLVKHKGITVRGDDYRYENSFIVELNMDQVILCIGTIMYLVDDWEVTLLQKEDWEEE